MTDLVAWLRSALDEHEQVARKAPSSLDSAEWPFWVDIDYEDDHAAACAWRDAFKPSVALRTVQAHRAILDAHPLTVYTDEEPGYTQVVNDHLCPGTQTPCLTLRALAAIYRDRPGFDPDWSEGVPQPPAAAGI